jgi:hypothetical protein
MRGVAWTGGLLLAAGAYACDGASFAQAGSLPVKAPDAAAPHADHFLIYSGIDGWQNGTFGYAGVTWAPKGLNEDGFILKFLAGSGTYRYLNGTTDTLGIATVLDAMPGWHFKYGSADVTLYAGLDLQSHRLRPDDLANNMRGLHAGARIGADLWWEPSQQTMTSANVSYATVGQGFWSRLAYGWRLLDKFYAGPEVHAMGDDTYRQWRAGAHLTALRIGSFEWSLGAGFVEDSDSRSGFYGRIGVLLRR